MNIEQNNKPQYDGIEIRAASGIHEEAMELINKTLAPRNNSIVLDIAAGRGAFSKRLQDFGYTVEANEIESEAFLPTGIMCSTVDLNFPFAESFGIKKYSLVVAVEVIEHLYNPIMFLIECHKILKQDGYLLISTPNILIKDQESSI